MTRRDPIPGADLVEPMRRWEESLDWLIDRTPSNRSRTGAGSEPEQTPEPEDNQ